MGILYITEVSQQNNQVCVCRNVFCRGMIGTRTCTGVLAEVQCCNTCTKSWKKFTNRHGIECGGNISQHQILPVHGVCQSTYVILFNSMEYLEMRMEPKQCWVSCMNLKS